MWNDSRRGLIFGVGLLSLWTIVGTLAFMTIEGWPLRDALHMTVITLSTVGYGEVQPLSRQGRWFATGFIVVGLGTAVYTFTRLGQIILEGELLGRFVEQRMQKRLQQLDDHYLLCGFGRFARPVAEGLHHRSELFCVVDSDEELRDELSDRGYAHIIGDATNEAVLKRAGVDRARMLLALLPSDSDNLYVTVTAKALNGNISVIARASDESAELMLKRGGATDVVSPYRLAGYRLLQAAVSPSVVHFMEQVADRSALNLNLGQIAVSEQSPLRGATIADHRIRHKYRVTVIGVHESGETTVKTADPNRTLESGDVLILLGTEQHLQQFQADYT